MPGFHSFRHTAASEAIHAGDSAEEVSWLLGHKDSTVTRRVYVTEIQSVERSGKRREKMEARMGGTLSRLSVARTAEQDRTRSDTPALRKSTMLRISQGEGRGFSSAGSRGGNRLQAVSNGTEDAPLDCPTCNGIGWRWWAPATAPKQQGEWRECRNCLGTGNADQRGQKRPEPQP